MRQVQDLLVVCVGVDGGHEAALDRVLVMHDFRRRRQTVRGAGGIRNNVVLLRVILVLVDAQHDGQVFAFRRSGDDDFLGATAGDVIDCALDGLALLVDAVFLDGEQAGGLRSRYPPPGPPMGSQRIGLFESLDLLAIDDQTVIVYFDRAIEAAIVRIVLEQVRHGLHVADVVERNDFQFASGYIIADRLKYLTTNTAKSVNTNFD